MAVPAEMTTLNISGKYYQVRLTLSHRSASHIDIDISQDKSQSDDTDEILRLQGVGWMTRKIIQTATLYLTVNHRTENGLEIITVDQVLSGGMGNSSETRPLDWGDREVDDPVFGLVVTRSRRAKLEDIEHDFLKQDWPEDVKEHGLIQTSGHSDTPKSGRTWVAEMVRKMRSPWKPILTDQ